jgi:hypothetical protein
MAAGGAGMVGGSGASAVSAAAGGAGPAGSTFSASALAVDPKNLNIPQTVASKLFKETIRLNKTENDRPEKQG